MSKLAILFMTSKPVSVMTAWELWREGAKFQVVFHIHPFHACVMRDRKPSFVQSAIQLIKHAHTDESTHCVLVSGDTVPLASPDDLVGRISDKAVTVTQFGTQNGWPRELTRLFEAMHFDCDPITYHHQSFAMTRDGMQAVVSEEERIMRLVWSAHNTCRELEHGFSVDELWLNFVPRPRAFARITFFQPDDDDSAMFNPPLSDKVRRTWLFARRYDRAHSLDYVF